MTISKNSIVLPQVKWEGEHEVEDFVLIGKMAKKTTLAGKETCIGANALIRSHTVIYSGNRIGDRFQTGHGVLIREENEIGDDVSIGSGSIVEHHVKIGNRVRLHSNVFIPEYSVLEDDCWIGPNVVFTNALYPLGRDVKSTLKGPTIRSGAKIGANSTLLPGIVIGRNSLVGAGSVITHDVPDGKVVAGNPARILKDTTEIPSYRNIK